MENGSEQKKSPSRWKVLFLTLEYVDPIFSGNGVHARTVAGNLACRKVSDSAAAHKSAREKVRPFADVMVICATPQGQIVTPSNDDKQAIASSGLSTGSTAGTISVHTVTVPTWYKLDRTSSWKEFGLGVAKFAEAVKAFSPDIVLGVDWTSILAIQTLKSLDVLLHTPTVFCNFRLFHESSGISEEERQFYRFKESLAVRLCQSSVALCKNDANILKRLNETMKSEREQMGSESLPDIFILNPPLRKEMLALAQRQRKIKLNHSKQLLLYRKSFRNAVQDSLGNCADTENDGMTQTTGWKRSASVDTMVTRGNESTSNGTYALSSLKEDHVNGVVPLDDEQLHGDSPRKTNGSFSVRRHRSLGSVEMKMQPRDSDISESLAESNPDLVQHGFGGPQPVMLSYLKSQRDSIPKRRYVTCCCRICPEKNVSHFIDVVLSLADFLKANQIIPCLVGPPVDNEYANTLYRKLDGQFPGNTSKIVSKFLPPQDLAGIFSETILNFHPALYEAFGMTIVEAAAFGAPTIMHYSGEIGAADIIPSPKCSILCDMTNTKSCARVVRSFLNPERRSFLDCIGSAAAKAANGWDDLAFSSALFSIMEKTVQSKYKSFEITKAAAVRVVQSSSSLSRSTSTLADSAPSSYSIDAAPTQRVLEPGSEEDIWKGIRDWDCAPQHHKYNDDQNKLSIDSVRQAGLSMVMLPLQDFTNKIESVWKSMVKTEVEKLRSQSSPEEFKVGEATIEARRQAKFRLESERHNSQTVWARFFIDEKKFPSISQARYRLVPSKVPEVGFWTILFQLIKRAAVQRAEVDPFTALHRIAVRNGSSIHSELTQVLSQENKRDSDPAANSDPVQLSTVARALCSCDNIVVLTGFPAVDGNTTTPQKRDGPAGAALIVHALHQIGGLRSARLLTERSNSYPLLACMGVLFGARLHWRGSAKGYSEEIYYNEESSVCVETFATASGFRNFHLERLEELRTSLSPSTHILCIERVGCAQDGSFYKCSGEKIPVNELAPLEKLLTMERDGEYCHSTAVLSGAASVVGMGRQSFEETISMRIPLGDEIRCIQSTDYALIGSQATLACFSLCAALALVAAEENLCSRSEDSLNRIMGTEEQIRSLLEATVAAGCWDCDAFCPSGVPVPTGKRIGGMSFENLLLAVGEMRSVVLGVWEKFDEER